MKKTTSPDKNKSFRKVSDEECKVFYGVFRIRNDEILPLVEKKSLFKQKEDY